MQPLPAPTRRRARRWPGPARLVARLTALAVLSAVLVVVPAPRVEAVETMHVDTRRPALGPVGSSPEVGEAVVRPSGEDVSDDLTDPGRRRAMEEVEPFAMLGVTVPAMPSAHLLARARVDGAWGPWMELEVNPDHRPEGKERAQAAAEEPGVHSAPIWVDDADAYEVNVPADVGSLEVHLVRPDVERIEVDTTGASAAAAPSAAAPPILSRSQWGARQPAATPTIADDLKLAVVHHSVNSNAYSREDVPAMLRGIQAYHMDTNGWNDIAYNFAVDRFGRIWEARAGGVTKAVIGGHAAGFNTFTTGVMVLGDFTSSTPTQASVDAVADVIGWKFATHRQDVRGSTQFTSLGGPRYSSGTVVQLPRIVGHRDVGQTACPGSELYRRLGEIRTKAAAQFDRYILDQPEQPLFGDFDGDGHRDILRYRPGGGSDVLWSQPGGSIRRTGLTIDGTFRPVVGDYDGDGRDDVFWYGPGSHYDRIWYGGAGGFTSRVIDVPEHGLPHVAELDGDGIDDLVVYAPGGSPDRIYRGQGGRSIRALPLSIDGTYDVLVGDYDGDERDDLFLYGKGSRPDTRAFSLGNGSFDNVTTEVSGWFAPEVGDFDGNGQDDVVWYAPGTAADEIWWSEPLRRGAVSVQAVRVNGTGYRPEIGDVTGDGVDDVFWYQPGAGGDPVWSWSVLRVKRDELRSVGGTYVADIGRYTADDLDDIAWMSDSGASYLWKATGNGAVQSAAIG